MFTGIDNPLTASQIRDLLRCADQSQAHGNIERARWYRVWATTGKQVGDKPAAMPKGAIYNGPVS